MSRGVCTCASLDFVNLPGWSSRQGLAAEAAGVQQGDEIVAVDDEDVTQRAPFEVATLIAGPPPGASEAAQRSDAARRVSLRVRHAGGAFEDVALLRPAQQTVADPVKWSVRRLGGESVGVIRLAQFNARAVPGIKNAIEELSSRRVSQLVLDLSDNRGGLVNEGVEIARMFLDPGSTVFVTRGKADAVATRVDGGRPLTQLPLTVLVNGSSASASEILAGALKDNCRAVVAGKTSFGKGLIQSVYELSDSSGLIVTVGKYLTPAGLDIDRTGIRPDFASPPRLTQWRERIEACRLERVQE